MSNFLIFLDNEKKFLNGQTETKINYNAKIKGKITQF